MALSSSALEFAGNILAYEHVASYIEAKSRPEYASVHLRAGLDSGYLCVYATEEREETASRQLLQFGLEQKFLKEGQCKIVNVNQIYPDDFTFREIIAKYRSLYDTAIDQRFKGFLVVRSVFGFFHDRRRLLERFLSYEMAFENAKLPCKTTCLYPLGMMSLEHVLSTMSSHPHVCTPSNAMTSHKFFDLAFTGAFGEILGESATKAITYYMEQKGHYSPGLIFTGLESLFGAQGAKILIEPFHMSIMEIIGGSGLANIKPSRTRVTNKRLLCPPH